MVTDPATTLIIKREFKAPVERVFAAWTQPDLIAKWFFGPECTVGRVHKADVRVGGSYDFEMETEQGEVHRVRGTYEEVATNERLVFTWAWISTPDRQSRVEVQLQAAGEITKLTLTHSGFTDAEARDKHGHGWNGCLDNLEVLFS